MAVKYLDKFASKVNRTQVQQALQLLNEKRQSGEIRTVEEFTNRLQELVQGLTTTNISPTLQVYEAVPDEDIDSPTYNHMLDRVRDDLRTAFTEANNIDEVQQSHRALLRDVVFKNIRRAVDELEVKVDGFENTWNKYGSEQAQISGSFKEASANRTRRADTNLATLFSDARTGKIINNDAFVETKGERLTLPTTTDEEYRFSRAYQVSDADFPQSELIVQLPTNSMDNVIDQTENTYWIQSLLFSSIQAYAKVKLILTLPIERDINYIEIEPITDKGIILETIEYEDSSHTAQTLYDTDLTFTSPIRINFSRTTTQKLYLTFRNENAVPVDFNYNTQDQSLFSQTIEAPAGEQSPEIATVHSDLYSILSSDKLREVLGVQLPSDNLSFSGYSYTFGLDNIRTGLTLYDTPGIYVSPSVKIDEEVGNIYLEATETRPKASSPSATPEVTSTTYDGSDSDFYFSSIEYWVVKRDYDEKDAILQTFVLPLMPANKTRIHHERLVLSEKSVDSQPKNDVGKTLMFTDRTAGTVKVYRNGSLLSYGSDWTEFSTTAEKTPGSGSAMMFKVKIENPLFGDIYTVTYTPMKSTTRGTPNSLGVFSGAGPEIIDMKGDLNARYVADNNIALRRSSPKGSTVAYTNIALCIVVRNNSSRNALSAAVEDYKLFISTREGIFDV